MKKLGVIGLGNPLRRDDGIGIVLLDKLVKRKQDLPLNIEYIDGGTGGLNLIHLLSRFHTVVFLDAAYCNKKAGEGELFDLKEVKNNRISLSSSTHDSDILKVIQLLSELSQNPTNIFFFGIQPKDTSMGTSLSKELQQNINGLIDQVISTLKSLYEEVP